MQNDLFIQKICNENSKLKNHYQNDEQMLLIEKDRVESNLKLDLSGLTQKLEELKNVKLKIMLL